LECEIFSINLKISTSTHEHELIIYENFPIILASLHLSRKQVSWFSKNCPETGFQKKECKEKGCKKKRTELLF
jgi:hypothetical protein